MLYASCSPPLIFEATCNIVSLSVEGILLTGKGTDIESYLSVLCIIKSSIYLFLLTGVIGFLVSTLK